MNELGCSEEAFVLAGMQVSGVFETSSRWPVYSARAKGTPWPKAPASGRTPNAGATFFVLEQREAFGVRPLAGAFSARNFPNAHKLRCATRAKPTALPVLV